MIEFTFYSNEIPGIDSEFFMQAIPVLLKNEGKDLGDLTVIICTDNELLEINQLYLSHDYFTDIITFSYNDGTFVSGDLFISYDRVNENARELNVDFKEEFCRVVFHGILHLLGYNDKTPAESLEIRKKENQYLTQLFHVKQ